MNGVLRAGRFGLVCSSMLTLGTNPAGARCYGPAMVRYADVTRHAAFPGRRGGRLRDGATSCVRDRFAERDSRRIQVEVPPSATSDQRLLMRGDQRRVPAVCRADPDDEMPTGVDDLRGGVDERLANASPSARPRVARATCRAPSQASDLEPGAVAIELRDRDPSRDDAPPAVVSARSSCHRAPRPESATRRGRIAAPVAASRALAVSSTELRSDASRLTRCALLYMAAASRQSGVIAGCWPSRGADLVVPIVTSASSALRQRAARRARGMSRSDATRAGGRSVVRARRSCSREPS
jgi:hypothetical protein